MYKHTEIIITCQPHSNSMMRVPVHHLKTVEVVIAASTVFENLSNESHLAHYSIFILITLPILRTWIPVAVLPRWEHSRVRVLIAMQEYENSKNNYAFCIQTERTNWIRIFRERLRCKNQELPTDSPAPIDHKFSFLSVGTGESVRNSWFVQSPPQLCPFVATLVFSPQPSPCCCFVWLSIAAGECKRD